MMKKCLMILAMVSLAACGDSGESADPIDLNNVNAANNANNINNANNVDNPNNNHDVNNANHTGSDMGAEDMTLGSDMAESVDMSTEAEMGNSGTDMASEADMSMQPANDPAQTGPLGVMTASETISTNGRSIPLTVYLPAGSGPYPIIMFSHGMSLSASDFTHIGEHLGSHGYVVVMPDLPGSPFSPVPHSELSEILIGVLDWVESDIANGSLIGALGDSSLVGFAGHSLGGKISFLSAADDNRVDAVFGVDAVDSKPPLTFSDTDYPSVTPERMSDISVPIVSLGETVDAGGGFMPCAPSDENFQQYYGAATSPALEIEIVGADHLDFLDDPNCSTCGLCGPGTADPATTKAYTRKYLTAFFDLKLKGMTARATWLTGARMAADEATNEVVAQSKNGF